METTAKIASHLEAEHAVIALKGEYKREIQALSQAIEKLNAPVEIFQSEAFYPAGDEQVLVWNVTGRSIPEKGLPLDVGCVVDNVGTVLSIADALEEIPVCEKFLSVTGAVKETKMFHVPLGTAVTDILKAVRIIPGDYAVILGRSYDGENAPDKGGDPERRGDKDHRKSPGPSKRPLSGKAQRKDSAPDDPHCKVRLYPVQDVYRYVSPFPDRP